MISVGQKKEYIWFVVQKKKEEYIWLTGKCLKLLINKKFIDKKQKNILYL